MTRSLFAILTGVALVAGTSGAALAQTSNTSAQQSQRVHGSVVSVQGSTLTFKADDGRTLTVDMSKVSPDIRQALTPNEKATLIGTPGSQANQFTAQFIQQDSSNPARGGTVVGQTPAASGNTAQGTGAQQWQDVHGRVVSVQGDTMTFKADDGRTLTVDIKAVSPQVQQALKPNEGATVLGMPGDQPTQFTAQFIQQDSSDPSRGGTVVGQTPAADKSWQRIHGTVGAVSGNTLTLKTDAGQSLNVDMGQVEPGIRSSLTTGEGVTVIGFYRGADKKTVDARFIQQDSSVGAASPATTK